MVRVGIPVRLATVVFVGLCCFAIAMAMVAPMWMRIGSMAFDRLGDIGPDGSSQPQGAMLNGVFTYQLQRSLSCEYVSLHIATALLGEPVSAYTFDDLVAQDENPRRGYRGSITGEWGNTTDYGVHSEPLAAALNQVGFEGNAFYGDKTQLTSELDEGRPVVV